MMEWCGARNGAWSMTLSVGFFGERLVDAVRHRGGPPVKVARLETDGLGDPEVSVTGSEMRRMPSSPMVPMAISLPRCGVQMKTTRRTCGIRLEEDRAVDEVVLVGRPP